MSAKKTGLGRGFDVLIPKDLDTSLIEADLGRIQKLLTADIKANPEQPRREFDEKSLSGLASSIKQHGVLQPIIVVRIQGNGYRIVAGERRWRAAQVANLKHIPAIVRSLEELEQIELALIENIQRVDLSPLEQALSVYRLQHHFNLSLEQISKKLGKAQSTISNLSRLLRLPPAATAALRNKKITEGHARSILSLSSNPAKQDELLSSILNNGWTVRRAEQFVMTFKSEKTTLTPNEVLPKGEELLRILSTKFNSTVKLTRRAKGGQLIISFKSERELSDIVSRLKALPSKELTQEE